MPAASPGWVDVSDRDSMRLLESLLRFEPETASEIGLAAFDEHVVDLGPDLESRQLAALADAARALDARRATERDRAVLQDLEILADAVARKHESIEASRRLLLPYPRLAPVIFGGLRALLDEQNSAERRAVALTRLTRYAGLVPGTTPVTASAEARWRERAADTSLVGPARAEVEKDLATLPAVLDGIAPLFVEHGIAGFDVALATLREQAGRWAAFVRSDVLPRARADFRLPPEIYRLGLRDVGVDMELDELVSRAQVAYREIQNEMAALAPAVAREIGLATSDPRAVLATLRRKQVTGEAILPHFHARLAALEAIVVRERIVTLPSRPAQVRLASAAETVVQPAPHMDPPRVLGNTGERGTFVLPLAMPPVDGRPGLAYDDFTFEAASWTLTAHEARPGHELQFSANVERGISLARQLFAFNSVNVEGWALYMEAEMKPYLPLDGQFAALQHRLMRAARAFLDPGLQAGTVTPEMAHRVLTTEVGLSEGMTQQEIERYTFRDPGQATAYFCGYQRVMALRAETERTLGSTFDRLAFHDYILSQGLLPPRLLARAVREEFVPAQAPRG